MAWSMPKPKKSWKMTKKPNFRLSQRHIAHNCSGNFRRKVVWKKRWWHFFSSEKKIVKKNYRKKSSIEKKSESIFSISKKKSSKNIFSWRKLILKKIWFFLIFLKSKNFRKSWISIGIFRKIKISKIFDFRRIFFLIKFQNRFSIKNFQYFFTIFF